MTFQLKSNLRHKSPSHTIEAVRIAHVDDAGAALWRKGLCVVLKI
jgi:hypothetical protein